MQLLTTFYNTFSPEDAWKAQQVAEKFIDEQDRMWLLIYHKYKVCSCSVHEPCIVQSSTDARRQAREEEDDDDDGKENIISFVVVVILVHGV